MVMVILQRRERHLEEEAQQGFGFAEQEIEEEMGQRDGAIVLSSMKPLHNFLTMNADII